MNNYGILLNTIPYNLKKKIRLLERYGKKINNITWSIMFNQTCIKEDIMPKYCKFKMFVCIKKYKKKYFIISS